MRRVVVLQTTARRVAQPQLLNYIYVVRMTTTMRKRRERGTGKNTVLLNVHVEAAVKHTIDELADAIGVGQGRVIDLLLEVVPAPTTSRAKQVTRVRRVRGEGKNTLPLNAHIDLDTKSKLEALANARGLTQGRLIDALIKDTTIHPDGRPDFYTGPMATDYFEELPLATSA